MNMSQGKRAARVGGFIPQPGAMRKTVGLSHKAQAATKEKA